MSALSSSSMSMPPRVGERHRRRAEARVVGDREVDLVLGRHARLRRSRRWPWRWRCRAGARRSTAAPSRPARCFRSRGLPISPALPFLPTPPRNSGLMKTWPWRSISSWIWSSVASGPSTSAVGKSTCLSSGAPCSSPVSCIAKSLSMPPGRRMGAARGYRCGVRGREAELPGQLAVGGDLLLTWASTSAPVMREAGTGRARCAGGRRPAGHACFAKVSHQALQSASLDLRADVEAAHDRPHEVEALFPRGRHAGQVARAGAGRPSRPAGAPCCRPHLLQRSRRCRR